jgi:hypothetical protein
MTKEEIGFKHGIPENPERTWEKQIKGRTFQFSKRREGKSFFGYNCKIRSDGGRFMASSQTGFVSYRDLKPEEVEALPQFATFIESHNRA